MDERGATGRVVSIRPDEERRLTSRVGMIVFLGSWAMMFAALFFSYALLRFRSPSWPPPGVPSLPVALPALNTLLLAISSFTLHRAQRRSAQAGAPLPWLSATFGLGLVFLALQVWTWLGTWGSGLTVRSGTYGGVFYLLTVFHGLHVVVGLALLAWLIWATARPAAEPAPLGIVALFWHFVDVVWLLIFLTVYLS